VLSAGRRNRTKKMIAANGASVVNCLRRYAAAPSCTAREISRIFSVPWSADSTWRTKRPATSSASAATTATTMTML
jgi:hypothetical protein